MIRARPQVLFDATRLLSRVDRSTPTGIDRVCLAYAEHLLGRDDVLLTPVRTRRDSLAAIRPDWFRETVAELRARWSGPETPDAAEAALVSALTDPSRGRSTLVDAVGKTAEVRTRRSLGRVLAVRPLPALRRGALYVNVGHTGLDDPRPLRDLAGRGVRLAVMVHDLIPVTHPEYCRPGEAARHRRRMRAALRLSDRIMVNSDVTAAELADFAVREGLETPPVEVLKLGLEPAFLQPGWAPDQRPWFVHVGTLEARKNLAFLLTLWGRLAESMGDDAPRLALVGRHGWENEAALDLLERAPGLQGLVHQAAGLTDAGLSRLLRGARGLVAPSFVEGFDLPAVEAEALGVPVLASDIPAHRELLTRARLIDPLDGPGWLSAIRGLSRRRTAPEPAPAPLWADHFRRFDAFVGLES